MKYTEVNLSRVRVEIVLSVLGEEKPTDFAWLMAQDIVASDPYVALFLESMGLGDAI